MKVIVLCIIGCISFSNCLPPPAGVNMKPARSLGGEPTEEATLADSPPNLRVRSRMMAAQNSDDGKRDMVPVGSQPLILTKNRKHAKVIPRNIVRIATEAPRTMQKRPTLQTVPPSANYGVNPMVQTNFVDSSGRVLHNVVSVPIRVPDSSTRTKTVSASSTLLEADNDKPVEVRFGQAPI